MQRACRDQPIAAVHGLFAIFPSGNPPGETETHAQHPPAGWTYSVQIGEQPTAALVTGARNLHHLAPTPPCGWLLGSSSCDQSGVNMKLDFISPKTHAYLDYASVAVQSIAPRLLGLERDAGLIHRAALAVTSGYSTLTDYPGGVYKLLPLRTHLILDALAGVGFLTAAAIRRRSRAASFTLAGMGLLSLTAAFCTQTPAEQRRQRIASRGGRPLPHGETPMQRYAREQRPAPIAEPSPQRWPEFLQRQVMPSRAPQSSGL